MFRPALKVSTSLPTGVQQMAEFDRAIGLDSVSESELRMQAEEIRRSGAWLTTTQRSSSVI
jgi:hypothetical protein